MPFVRFHLIFQPKREHSFSQPYRLRSTARNRGFFWRDGANTVTSSQSVNYLARRAAMGK